MGLSLGHILSLGVKELYGLRTDPVLLIMIAYVFTFAIFAQATGAKLEVEHAAVGVVDEDRSELSRRIADALLEPYFKPAVEIGAGEIDAAMNTGRLTFVIEIPPKFEFDTLAGRRPTVQIDVDATTMTQAGNGAVYIQNIVTQEAVSYVQRAEGAIGRTGMPVDVVARTMFNPNTRSEWFNSVMGLVQHVNMLCIVLTGAALIREREHGTVEHLLVMPVRPAEIMLSKMWANGLVVIFAACASLWFVVHGVIGVPLAGSVALFVFGIVCYQASVGALGILLATFAGTMGQFGLLFVPVLVILSLLSGATSPTETIPVWLQDMMEFTPTPHYVRFCQDVLYRGAGLDVVWPQICAMIAFAVVFFGLSLARFRSALAKFQ